MAARKKQTGRKATPAKKKAGQRKKTTKVSTAPRVVKSAGGSAKPRSKAKKATARTAAPRSAAAVRKATRKAARKTSARKSTKAAAVTPKRGLLSEVEALAQLMEEHGLIDVSYAVEADGSKEIHVSRGGVPGLTQGAVAGTPAAAPLASSSTPAAPVEAAASEPVDESLHAFVSPMVGTFYRAPSPEAAAFVSVSDKVDTSSPVCIIEAMKVMNEITPDMAGEVVSIEVENGEAVEFGQTLMLLRLR